MPQSKYPLMTADWLRQRYEQDGATLTEMAQELGCTDATVLHAMRRAGIPTRSAAEQMKRRGTSSRRMFAALGDVAWLRRQYVTQGRSLPEIATEVGCTSAAVRKAVLEAGIPLRAEIERVYRGKVIPQLGDATWLTRQRVELGRSKEDIAQELGCSPDAVQKAFWRHHVVIKPPLPRGAALETAAPRYQRNSSGYVMRWSPNHPAANHKGFVAEHRLVAEEALGRLLKSREVVHHLNINPSDNRVENLIVFPTNGVKVHMHFHANPPAWVPRCECCEKPWPEKMQGRPEGVPLLYEEAP